MHQDVSYFLISFAAIVLAWAAVNLAFDFPKLIHEAKRIADALEKREQRIAALEAERLRYYHADGTFETLATAEEVIERRIAAAKRIASLEEKLRDTIKADAAEQAEARQLIDEQREALNNVAKAPDLS